MTEASTSSGSSDDGVEETPPDSPLLDDEELDTLEERLRESVPQLLEAMNRAAQDVNSLERQAGLAQTRYRKSVSDCSSLYSELRAKNGRTFDRVKPYFSAEQEVIAAAHRMQGITRGFSAAASSYAAAEQEGRPEEELTKLRQVKDSLEEEYVRALRENRAAKEALEALRVQLGESAIRRAKPDIEALQHRQLVLAVEHSRMNTIVERARMSKGVYQTSMRELERISTAVHDIRKARQRHVAGA